MPQTRFMEIEGDLVRVVTRNVETEVRLADMLPHMVKREGFFLPNTPHNLRHIEVTTEETLTKATVVIELAPTVRAINFAHGRAHERNEARGYKIALPWMHFVFHMQAPYDNLARSWTINDWRVYWSKEQPTTPTSPLWFVRLPNCYTDGRVCFGEVGRNNRDRSLGGLIDGTVHGFLTGDGNEDLELLLPDEYDDLGQWQDATDSDPFTWRHWRQWDAPANTNLRDEMHAVRDFSEPVTVAGTIPVLQLPMTYASIDEWWRSAPTDAQTRLTDVILGAQQWVMTPRGR